MTGGNEADCGRCREILSAEMDGEAASAEREQAAAHLERCSACSAWQDRAAAVTRRARTADGTGPDLVAVALTHAPRPRPAHRRPAALARAALGAVGLAQVALGVVALLGVTAHIATGGHEHMADMSVSLLGAGMAHAAHEAAAWNLALGTAFLVGALRPRHLAGLLPALGVFVVLLAVLSGIDLVGGRVDGGRVLAHLLLVAGFVLGLLVVRAGPSPRRGPAPGGRLDVEDPAAVPAGRGGRARRPVDDLDESAPDVA